MGLPNLLVSRISGLLGVDGQQHYADIPHKRFATECIVWELPASSEPKDIDAKLARVRHELLNENAVAYKSIDSWWGRYETRAHKIVVGHSRDQFDIIRYEMGPKSDAEYYISELRKFDDEYGIDITGAGYQTIEIVLKQIPAGEEATELVERILRFDPDIQQDGREPANMLDLNYHGGQIALWWD